MYPLKSICYGCCVRCCPSPCVYVYSTYIRRFWGWRVAKTLSEAPITTASARSKLGFGEYARRLDADAAIWYRKGKRGGVWFARWRNHGTGAAYKQAPIGAANDVNDKPAEGTFTFLQAEAAARKVVAAAREEAKALAAGPALTVRSSLEEYIADRDARDSKRAGRPIRSDAGQRLRRYVLGQPARGKQAVIPPARLAAVELHALTERDLLSWRDGLSEDLKASSRQRLVNDVKAALNATYGANRDRLSAAFTGTVKHGLRAIVDDDGDEPVARDNQILTDAQIGRLLSAAREVDGEFGWEGDLFRLMLVLAATGARFSQVARMRVSDCQIRESRLLIPTSRKGRGGKQSHVVVPVGQDVLEALMPVCTGRPGTATLLERWRYEQVAGTIRWQPKGRGRWQSSSEIVRPWALIRARVELPDVIPYAFRHSSIVRNIRANLPIRLVAALHDTSVQMIERHYAKWITSGLEEMARAAIVPMVPLEADVIPFRKGG